MQIFVRMLPFYCGELRFVLEIVLFFVPVSILIPTPFANRPNSLEKELSHSIVSGPRLKCLNSSEAPVFGSMTGCARYEFIVEYLDFKYWRT